MRDLKRLGMTPVVSECSYTRADKARIVVQAAGLMACLLLILIFFGLFALMKNTPPIPTGGEKVSQSWK